MSKKGSGFKSDETFAEMQRLYDSGFSMEAIAQACPGNGCAETIRKEFVRRGVTRRRTGPACNPVDDAEMLRLYKEGRSLDDLGRHYGVSEGTIRNYLEKLGEERRSKGSSRGEKHGKWRGGVHTKKGGHILLKRPDHPHRNRLGYVPAHRLVIEEAIGGYLLPSEVIHHEDHDPGNNTLSNLRLFCGKDEHELYGHPERLWGISRDRIAKLLLRIRQQRAKRRNLLTPEQRAARRALRQSMPRNVIRARMVVGEETRYVQVFHIRGNRRQAHEHRLVMADILGRPVTRGERVHHEDGNKSNNSLQNLFLFNSNGDHIKYHNWKGIGLFRGRSLADRYIAEKCKGMHNPWQPRSNNMVATRVLDSAAEATTSKTGFIPA
jgi:hypothetical protein